jgi:branched-chain amino acid transport system substrate-binding protein
VLMSCSGDDAGPPVTESAPRTTAAPAASTTAAPTTTAASTTTPEPEAWSVDQSECRRSDDVDAKITGTVQIGSVMPLTGGVAAAFSGIRDGFEAYLAYAREEGLFDGYDDVTLTVADDQYNPAATPAAVDGLIDAGVDLFSGTIGEANNLAVRETLNERCIPQLNVLNRSPAWGDVATFPWTAGLLVPYSVESMVYVEKLAELYPDGATVGLLMVNNEVGQTYADAFAQSATTHGLSIIDVQAVEATDTNPPTGQVGHLAETQPDVVMTVPIGAGCISFLTEIAAARVQHPEWTPDIVLANTCATGPILAAAGTAADGLYTSTDLLDIADPAVQALPAVADYVAYLEGIGKGDALVAAAPGWTTGEVTVAILNQAAGSPAGLTRASIIAAARDLELRPSLVRDGVVLRSSGVADPFLAETLQVVQYHASTATFTDVGELTTPNR